MKIYKNTCFRIVFPCLLSLLSLLSSPPPTSFCFPFWQKLSPGIDTLYSHSIKISVTKISLKHRRPLYLDEVLPWMTQMLLTQFVKYDQKMKVLQRHPRPAAPTRYPPIPSPIQLHPLDDAWSMVQQLRNGHHEYRHFVFYNYVSPPLPATHPPTYPFDESPKNTFTYTQNTERQRKIPFSFVRYFTHS